MITNPVFGNFQTFHKIQIYGILRKNQQKIPKSQIARIRRWNHQASLHPSYFYIITHKMVRQYLTVDSSIRQDKSG